MKDISTQNLLKQALALLAEKKQIDVNGLLVMLEQNNAKHCLELLILLIEESELYLPTPMRISLSDIAAKLGLDASYRSLIERTEYKKHLAEYRSHTPTYSAVVDGRYFQAVSHAYRYFLEYGRPEDTAISLEDYELHYNVFEKHHWIEISIMPRIKPGQSWMDIPQGGPGMTLLLSLKNYQLIEFWGFK